MAIAVFGALSFGLALFLKYVVAPRYGEDVAARFIERLNYIPSQKPALLDGSTLSRWLADERNKTSIAGYVFPVLFPLDLLFLVSLGLLLGFTSAALSGSLAFLAHIPGWVWWVFPLGYIAADLAEDLVVAAIFKSVIAMSEALFACCGCSPR
ncbi:hypothetical protein QA649_11295 [Bradyrhizobium sp. CB1717]|uniref:hypothetical protein n=1 Tax=Bradyrhizobium sp. CB1717 TaxID=3039154 RepID=UPI0024B0DB5F|nr:hypothetical protein [Bradyrhizobium sp. CB1717]WFU26762.1 hypothetical protein QA649_11295 [Bradyrhizobium sp. CB1717]